MAKRSDSNTLKRKIRMLDLLPDEAQGAMEAAELHDRLRADGYTVTRRTVERDLEQLAGPFTLQRRGGKPAGWYWTKGSKPRQWLGMDDETALLYSLLERFVTPLLPPPLLDKLAPQFTQARHMLASSARAPLKSWNRRIAAVPDTQPPHPPKVDTRVLHKVSRALLDTLQCEFDYRAVDEPATAKPKRHRVDPYGLVMRGHLLYLVAGFDGGKPYTFALHRMQSPKVSDTRSHVPQNFNAQEYAVDQHGLEFGGSGPIPLELRVSRWWARYLAECPLSSDQEIRGLRNSEDKRVSATVDDTEQLRWWLLSLGPDIEVRKPPALRKRMAREIRAMARRYAP